MNEPDYWYLYLEDYGDILFRPFKYMRDIVNLYEEIRKRDEV